MADSVAKQTLKQDRIMEVAFRKAEARAVIWSNIKTAWQKLIWMQKTKNVNYKV